jgi:hypothetical protein
MRWDGVGQGKAVEMGAVGERERNRERERERYTIIGKCIQ